MFIEPFGIRSTLLVCTYKIDLFPYTHTNTRVVYTYVERAKHGGGSLLRVKNKTQNVLDGRTGYASNFIYYFFFIVAERAQSATAMKKKTFVYCCWVDKKYT